MKNELKILCLDKGAVLYVLERIKTSSETRAELIAILSKIDEEINRLQQAEQEQYERMFKF